MNEVEPSNFIITRKRKKYKFALFHNNPRCFEVEQWPKDAWPHSLEIGAGTGLFSVALAEGAPDVEFVAVDVKADRLQKGAALAEDKKLSNVVFLRARADQLTELLQPHSLTSIWVTFPDPFPKDRMAKHRLTHPHFLALYKTLLAPGGALYFKTDATALFEWSLEQFSNEGWAIEELSFDLHESNLADSYRIKTTYEARYVNEGLKINFVKVHPSEA